MLKKIGMFFIVISTIFSSVLAKDIELDSPSGILVEMESARVIYEKNAGRKMYPASMTKIMTAILAIEKNQNNLDEILVASSKAVNSIEPGSSSIGIMENEQLTFRQCLYGLLVPSANEIANILAEYVAGDIKSFIPLMNEKAKEIGVLDTNFVNPSGLHDDNHYTTCYDMALITRYAMQNEFFREIVSTPSYNIGATNRTEETRYLYNTNKFITNSKYFDKNVIGVKTGYTSKAGNTLASVKSKDGMEFIAVIMGAESKNSNVYTYEDSNILYDSAFENFSNRTIAGDKTILYELPVKGGKLSYVTLQTDREFESVIEKGIKEEDIKKTFDLPQSLKAPIEKNESIGTVSFSYENSEGNLVELGEVNLTTAIAVEQTFISKLFDFIVKFRLVIIISLAVLVILFILGWIRHKRNRRKKYNRFKF